MVLNNRKKGLILVWLAFAGLPLFAAELAVDRVGIVRKLPATPDPHWVWVNDISFSHTEAGKAFLVSGGSGELLGMLSTGMLAMTLVFPGDYNAIYSPETYWSRGTRGIRTDVVTVYDPIELKPIREIRIPGKRAMISQIVHSAALTGSDQFLGIYNFTPAQSISIVDVINNKFIEEISLPGCALVYSIGKRRLASLCANGTLLIMDLDEKGNLANKQSTERFFDPEKDFLTEKAVRYNERWLFVSVGGYVYPVVMDQANIVFDKKWTFLTDEEREAQWIVGGLQHSALHSGKGLLYLLMHQGGDDSYRDPGDEIWVYNLETRKRIKKIHLETPATSIHVTQDDEPLLFTAFFLEPALNVYDAMTGDIIRKINELGLNPSILVSPVSK